jgi:putative PEP-CTERM system histidine kinase
VPTLGLNPSQWYWVAGLAFLLLGLQALLGRSRLIQWHRLGLAGAGLAWSGYHALGAAGSLGAWSVAATLLVELLFQFAWFALLYRALRGPYLLSMPETVRRGLQAYWATVVVGAVIVSWIAAQDVLPAQAISPLLTLSAALACLALAAQLYRDAPLEDPLALRWLIWAGAAAGGSQALVFAALALVPGLSIAELALRALPVAVSALLVAAAARRRPQWSLAVFVSPQARAYAPRLLGMLCIFLALVLLAPALRALPGAATGGPAIVTLTLLGLPAIALLFSEDLSARLRVFVSKHFLPFRYDYREEWLRLIDTLASPAQRLPLPERTIKAVAQIVGSPAGVLWLRRNEDDPFQCVANWNTRAWPDQPVPADDPVLEFMRERQWIMDTAELNRDPAMYEGMERPEWLERFPDALLVVPLISSEMLIGFIVLFQSSSAFRLTFEEIDLLRTSGRQIAAYLAQYQADQQLAEARQFEAFNRLTAFVMHDLKNLIAQQSLVVRNAGKHKGNPEFFEDAIATIDNSVARMSRLLKQLQSGESAGPRQAVRLADALQEAIARCSGRRPEPELEMPEQDLLANLERERFVTVLSHLVRNAQDATDDDGSVRVCLRSSGENAEIEISDDGAGMEPDFLRNRLFRPFDSTKGSKGMGIGAYQARAFIVDSGGRLDVWSEPGRGSRFTISLPARVAESAAAVSA